MKKNYKNVSLLVLSVMLTFASNGAYAVTQDPTSIAGTVTVNTSITNAALTEYFSQTTGGDVNVGGGIYNVTTSGTLNIGTTNNVTFSNISAMINPDGLGESVGRMGGVVYNEGDLYIGSQVNGGTVSATGEQVTFSGNQAGQGGAINNSGQAYIYNAVFENNKAITYNPDGGSTGIGWDTAQSGRGGAILNVYNTLDPDNTGEITIIGTQFNTNSADLYGGAIYNGNGGEIIINGGSTFTGNEAGNDGGAIYNSITDSSNKSATIDIHDVTFDSNYAKINGGAIFNRSDNTHDQSSIININGANFSSNTAGTGGGAISNQITSNQSTAEVNIINTTFENNGLLNYGGSDVVTGSGGAIYNSGTVNIQQGSSFTGNKASTSGGAVYNTGTTNISNATFTNNGGTTTGSGYTAAGGAIYSNTSVANNGIIADLTISNTTFSGNSANSGGAIYNGSTATITDSNFTNNTARSYGGAIYGATGSDTTVIAQNRDVNFSTATDSIYLNVGTESSSGAVINLDANTGRNINLNGAVDGATTTTAGYVPTVNVNYNNANYQGNVNFNNGVSNVNLNVYNGTANANSQVSNSTVTTQGGTIKFSNDEYLGTTATNTSDLNSLVLNGGTVDIRNGVVSNIKLDSFALQSNTNMKVDVDVVNERMDNLLQENIGDGTGANVNIANGSINISDMNLVNEGEKESANILFTNVNGLSVDNVNSSVDTLEGKIYRYSVNKVSGADLGFSGDAMDDVYFSFNNTFKPSDNVTQTPVAQIGAFLLMDNIYRQSFANMDMLTILTRDERENLKNYNRYANMFEDEINTFYRDKRQEDYPSAFVRAFTNFEKVPLKRGPHVDNIFYGTLIGHESGLYELGKGWDANYAVFGAYTGAYQHYSGINMWQNGGAAGGVFTAYKGDFWAGITANAGGWAVEANNDYGSEHFPMMGAGVAAKAGYNFRLFNNKFIIQPSYMMSYTFIYAYSHNNAAGVHIKQDPLHAIEIIPGVKLIANNFKNGWQPYLAVNMTWVCMDGARFWANDIAFNRLSIRPFVEYGIGIQKHHGEHATGYLQAMVRNGGRNGVALTGGFRWAIGEDIID